MKISIRFFNDKEVSDAWNEENNKWYFSVLDIIGQSKKKIITKNAATIGNIQKLN